MSAARRAGFVLPVVLIVIGLLALMMAGFVFFVRAEVAGVRAERDGQQARLAAESGLQEVILALRTSRDDPTAWWDVPDRFRNVLVWSEGYDRAHDPVRKAGTRREILADPRPVPAWRFSVVAENLDGLPNTMRFGITPEASKLNLNAAGDEEIERLLLDVLPDLGVENAPELAACLLDWLDEDDETRPSGAETDYYSTLRPGYLAKNGRLDTLEELLLVKGFSAAILYGEDTNRNGILDKNEDDGSASFPHYDNGDGLLAHGLASYVTVWSRESAASPGTGGTPGGGTPTGGTPSTQPSGSTPGGSKPGGKKSVLKTQVAAPQQEGTGDETGAGAPSDQDPGTATDGTEPGTSAPPTSQPGAATSGQQTVEGRINVNTASVRVLRAIIGDLDPQAPEKIVAARQEQEPEALKTTDWLVASGAISAEAYAAVKDRLTTKAYQFHVEIVGYADHTKMAKRYEWIVEVRGPVVQTLYHRDLTGLGFAWPVDDDTVVVKQK